MLLEYADKGSLEDFFQSETPPSHGGEIIKFWEGLFLLIKGLKAIHSVQEQVTFCIQNLLRLNLIGVIMILSQRQYSFRVMAQSQQRIVSSNSRILD